MTEGKILATLPQLAPILVVNDETGGWVVTANVTRVVAFGGEGEGSIIYVRQDLTGGSSATVWPSCVTSPLSPNELRRRALELDNEGIKQCES